MFHNKNCYFIFVLNWLQKKVQVWWFCVSFSRKHRCFDPMGREFGHSLSINMVRISMYYILICLLVLRYRWVVYRRDTRGAYHLFGGGSDTQNAFHVSTLRYIMFLKTHVRMIESHTLFPINTHDCIPYDSCQLV